MIDPVNKNESSIKDFERKIKSDPFKIKEENKDSEKYQIHNPVSEEKGRRSRPKNMSPTKDRVKISREMSSDSTNTISKTSVSSSPLRRKNNDQPTFEAVDGLKKNSMYFSTNNDFVRKTSSEQPETLAQGRVSSKEKFLTNRSRLLLMSKI